MNPATIYLSKWAPSSDTYRTMRSALRVVARALDPETDAETYPWQDLRFETARGIPAKLERLRPSTINKCVIAVRGVLKCAWKAGTIPGEEYLKIEIEKVGGKGPHAGRAFTDEEQEMLSEAIDQAEPKVAAVLILGGYCGLRRVEIARLKKEDYDLKTHQIRAMGKGQKTREITIATDWQKKFEAHWKTVPKDGWLFESVRGGKLTRSGISYLVEKFCREFKGSRFTPHDLRRTFCTVLLDNPAVDVFTVQRLMGHTSLDTTKIYDRRGNAAEVAAVEMMTERKGEPMSPEEETALRAEYDRIATLLYDLDMERSMEFTRSQIGKCYFQKWPNEQGVAYLCVTGDYRGCYFNVCAGDFDIVRNYGAPSVRDLLDAKNGRTGGWTEITPEEYDAAWSKFVFEIQTLNPHEHFEENP